MNHGVQGPELTERLEVAGFVHEDHVSRPNQVPDDEVDRAGDTAGEQDLTRECVDPDFRQVPSQVLAQRGKSPWIAVGAEQAANPETCQSAQAQFDAAVVQPRRRRPAASGKVLQGDVEGLAPNHPEEVGISVQAQARLLRSGANAIGGEEADAASRLYMSRSDQPVIGLYHRELADAERGGNTTDGGQAGARAKYALTQQSADFAHDLVRERATS